MPKGLEGEKQIGVKKQPLGLGEIFPADFLPFFVGKRCILRLFRKPAPVIDTHRTVQVNHQIPLIFLQHPFALHAMEQMLIIPPDAKAFIIASFLKQGFVIKNGLVAGQCAEKREGSEAAGRALRQAGFPINHIPIAKKGIWLLGKLLLYLF